MTTSNRFRLAPGRTVLWRNERSLQLGIDPRHALVIDGLNDGLAAVVSHLDGRHETGSLVSAAATAGAEAAAVLRLLDELAGAGVVEPADRAGHELPALAPDAASWALRTGRSTGELLARRAMATVEVHGNGRVAIGVAGLLAAAGVGAVVVHATGRVAAHDVGTGYLPREVGEHRRQAAAHAVHRARTVHSADHSPGLPDVVVLADNSVWDPHLALRLVAGRVPHIAVHAREASIVVGPLVLPGRTSCLRCADLHRTDSDPCWPRLAAQLAGRPPAASLPAAHLAAGMAAEQVLALLAGRGEAPDEPPATATTFELDPLHGELVRRHWPVHPRCRCGAMPDPGVTAATGGVGVSRCRKRDNR